MIPWVRSILSKVFHWGRMVVVTSAELLIKEVLSLKCLSRTGLILWLVSFVKPLLQLFFRNDALTLKLGGELIVHGMAELLLAWSWIGLSILWYGRLCNSCASKAEIIRSTCGWCTDCMVVTFAKIVFCQGNVQFASCRRDIEHLWRQLCLEVRPLIDGLSIVLGLLEPGVCILQFLCV